MKLPISFEGDVIRPGDTDYDQASTNFVRKGAPALILRPRSASATAQAIRCGLDNKLVISVRGGGHSNAGLSTNDGGLVIDLKHLRDIEVVDAKKRLVRLGAGLTWAEAATALHSHGWAVSSGDTKTVGIGGLALGAGIGWMVRKYGLALDNLVAAEVVTADGRILRASHSEHEDLFWALRGGGGNFGIVTSFEFAAQPVTDVYAGNIVYDRDDVAGLLTKWRDHMRTAPDELTTMFLVMPAFGEAAASAVITCVYAGDDHDAAMGAIEPLLHLGGMLHQDIAKKSYPNVLEDAHAPQGIKIIVNNTFVRELSDELIATMARHEGQILQIRSVGGAMNHVPTDAMAFAHRRSEALIVAPVFLPPTATPEQAEAALEPWRDIAAYGDGAYINFFSEATPEQVHAAYPPDTYQRLARIKAAYDPHNVFNQNLNIKPAKE